MYIRSDAEDAKQKTPEIDSAVDRNLIIKNNYLAAQKIGFHFIDRGPMDALAFQNSEEDKQRRRTEILSLLGNRVEEGEICLLAAAGTECEKRNWRRGRPPTQGGDAAYFDKQLAELRNAYGLSEGHGYWSDRSDTGSVARQITLKALLEAYEPWSP